MSGPTLCHIASESFGLSHAEGKPIACGVGEPVQTQHDDVDESGCLKLHLDCNDWQSLSGLKRLNSTDERK